MTLLKNYIHSVDICEQLRSELVFSDPDKIRMYSDERRGIRLKPFQYNKSARRVEFPNAELNFELLTPATAPSARSRVAMAYDSNRKIHVLYGGISTGGPLNDTWEFDGTNWTQVTPAANPGNLAGHTMVFDSDRNVIVLFGGDDGVNPKNETWEYDGINWTKVTTVQNPQGAIDASMYYDPDRQRIVLFGGEGPIYGTYQNETWEFYSGDWNQVITASIPQLRRYQRVDYDKRRKIGVLFGGVDPTVNSLPGLRDTWEFNGTDWARVQTDNAPTARIWNGQYYDEVLQLVVVYAGYKTQNSSIQIFGTDWRPENYYRDVWGYDGITWFQIEGLNLRRNFAIGEESYDTDLCKALLWFGTDGSPDNNLFDETYWVEFQNTNITCRLPRWSPQAVKGWGGFEEISRRESGLIIQWRVSDGTNDYWFDGTSWVITALNSEWNTEIEISANINTFPFVQRSIQFVCRLITVSRWETPVLLGYRLLIVALFDWFEDLVVRSLVPRIEEDFTFQMDWSGVLESATDRFNVKTDYPFIPEEDLNIVDIEAVYNEDADPNHDLDLLQSFNANTGEAILTASLPADTRLFYYLKVAPEVAINFTNTDYDEIGKTPTIIIDQITFEARQVEASVDMALKDRTEGRKLSAPLWVERMNVQCAMITGKTTSAFRLMGQAYAFVVRGATQQAGHKPGGILKTKALDLEHTLKIVPVSRYNPKSDFSDLKETTFQLVVCDFYAWLRDMEQTDLVTRFNPSIAGMREVGTGNPSDERQPLPAGAIPVTYRAPEVEEV